jgi:tRNA(Ile)-lysidine synthase
MDLKVELAPGKYIIAVSGGVDSVVLLDLLSSVHRPSSNVQLIVAHFDHGIRSQSSEDAQFVKSLAEEYALPFELGSGDLGPDASEAEARDKRYAFLNSVKDKHQAKAIITAHHQDDVIETSIINLLRGTGRLGLTSLKSRNHIIRPLLDVPKTELLKYASEHNLKWHEDSTNLDTKYLRNKVRLEVVPKMTPTQKEQWLNILKRTAELNVAIDKDLSYLLNRGLHKGQLVLSRKWFAMLPHAIAREVVANLLIRAGAIEIDKKTIERLAVQIKTLRSGKVLQASGVDILLTKRSARFKSR